MSNETGSPENTMVEPKTDPKQITFKLNTQSVLLWRRTFLLRYFLNLGEYHNTDVKWTDYDTKNHRLELNDEQAPFKWSIPHGSLYKDVKYHPVIVIAFNFRVTVTASSQDQYELNLIRENLKIVNKRIMDMNAAAEYHQIILKNKLVRIKKEKEYEQTLKQRFAYMCKNM